MAKEREGLEMGEASESVREAWAAVRTEQRRRLRRRSRHRARRQMQQARTQRMPKRMRWAGKRLAVVRLQGRKGGAERGNVR